MRFSRLFGRTLRASPTGSDAATSLALRAGLVHVAPAGVELLPLGYRTLSRLKRQLRALWPEAQPSLAAPGHDRESWGSILSAHVQSYRQLPFTLLVNGWIETDRRREASLAQPGWTPALTVLEVVPAMVRPPGGENEVASAFQRWCDRVGLRIRQTDVQVGEHEWVAAVPDGPVTYLACDAGDYCAPAELARFQRREPSAVPHEERRLVATPGADTIAALADFLGIEWQRTLKALFLTSDGGEIVFVVLRGNLEVSLKKLAGIISASGFRPSSEAEIRALGVEPGYASPIGLRVRDGLEGQGVLVIADVSVQDDVDFVAGANRAGFHWSGVRLGRDFQASIIGDIAAPPEGAGCPDCGSPLRELRGYAVARSIDLPGPRFTDEHGKEGSTVLHQFTLTLYPLLSSVIATGADEKGIAWPPGLAPFDIDLVDLKSESVSEKTYEALQGGGWSVLWDDRAVSPGVKFADADLIGIPLRVTVSPRSLALDGVELSRRGGAAPAVVGVAEVRQAVVSALRELM